MILGFKVERVTKIVVQNKQENEQLLFRVSKRTNLSICLRCRGPKNISLPVNKSLKAFVEFYSVYI